MFKTSKKKCFQWTNNKINRHANASQYFIYFINSKQYIISITMLNKNSKCIMSDDKLLTFLHVLGSFMFPSSILKRILLLALEILLLYIYNFKRFNLYTKISNVARWHIWPILYFNTKIEKQENFEKYHKKFIQDDIKNQSQKSQTFQYFVKCKLENLHRVEFKDEKLMMTKQVEKIK